MTLSKTIMRKKKMLEGRSIMMMPWARYSSFRSNAEFPDSAFLLSVSSKNQTVPTMVLISSNRASSSETEVIVCCLNAVVVGKRIQRASKMY